MTTVEVTFNWRGLYVRAEVEYAPGYMGAATEDCEPEDWAVVVEDLELPDTCEPLPEWVRDLVIEKYEDELTSEAIEQARAAL